jgi:AcrR family transcriptional regulator
MAGRPRRFSREQVVAAAIEILQAEGQDGLTMKAISTKLGTGVGTLYSYAAGKEEIMTLVAADIVRCVAVPPVSLPWEDFVAGLIWSIRDTFRELPWLTSQILDAPGWSEAARSMYHGLGRVLGDAGFDDEVRPLLGRMLMFVTAAVVLGETADERRQPRSAVVATCIETVINGMRAHLATPQPA